MGFYGAINWQKVRNGELPENRMIKNVK